MTILRVRGAAYSDRYTAARSPSGTATISAMAAVVSVADSSGHTPYERWSPMIGVHLVLPRNSVSETCAKKSFDS